MFVIHHKIRKQLRKQLYIYCRSRKFCCWNNFEVETKRENWTRGKKFTRQWSMNKHVRKTTHPKVNVRLMTTASNTWLSQYLVESLNSVGTFQVLVHICNTVWRETFEGENFCEFHSFVAIRESFSAKFWGDMACVCMAKGSNPWKFSPQNCSWRIDVQPPGTMTVWTLFFFKLSATGVHY